MYDPENKRFKAQKPVPITTTAWGALIGETNHIAKDAYTYTGVDISQADKATRTCCASRPGTSHIETTCTIDHTSELLRDTHGTRSHPLLAACLA